MQISSQKRLNIYADPQTEEQLIGIAVLMGDNPVRTSLPFILTDIDNKGLIPVKEQKVYVLEYLRVQFVMLTTPLGESYYKLGEKYVVPVKRLKNVGLLSSYTPMLNKKSTKEYLVDKFININGIEIY